MTGEVVRPGYRENLPLTVRRSVGADHLRTLV